MDKGFKRFLVVMVTAGVILIGLLSASTFLGKKEEKSAKATPDAVAAQSTEKPKKTAVPDSSDANTEEPAKTPGATPSKTPSATYEPILSDKKVKTYPSVGVVVAGDSAYEMYNYVDSVVSQYAKVLNAFRKKLDAKVKIFDIVAPTSAGITFPDNLKDKVNLSDQGKASKKIAKKLAKNISFVPAYEALMAHRTEYIYFRTDHHWTSLGAYYAYSAFCKEKGIEPNAVEGYKKKAFKGFTGSFYKDTKQNKKLRKDTMEVLYPVDYDALALTYTDSNGKKFQAPVIANAANYSASLKYCAYIASDNPFTVIKNKNKKDGSSCVVIKESFGNAFVPFLADHYQNVYVIDYRYWNGKLQDFIRRKKCNDVLFVNNMSMTRNSYLVTKLSQIL